MDEIGELPANIQAKLLRVLQEKGNRQGGGTKPIPINVRVIAATNINLEQAIANGSFREDLVFQAEPHAYFHCSIKKEKRRFEENWRSI